MSGERGSREIHGQAAFRSQRTHQQVAGRHKVRLHDQIERGWSLRAVSGNAVIGPGGCTHILHGTNRDDIRIVAGGSDGAIAVGCCGVGTAVVAGGHHHHDASLPRLFHGQAKRIGLIGFIDRAAQREVDHPDVVLTLQGDGLLNTGNHVAVSAVAILIQHPDIDQVDARGNTLDGPIVSAAGGVRTRTGDQPRNVGSVTKHVAGAARGKLFPINNLAADIGIIADAAVDNRYANAGAIHAELISQISTHGGHGLIQHDHRVAPDGPVGRDVFHIRIIGQFPQHVGRNRIMAGFDQIKLVLQRASAVGYFLVMFFRWNGLVADDDVEIARRIVATKIFRQFFFTTPDRGGGAQQQRCAHQ